jgi:hypothetical protein
VATQPRIAFRSVRTLSGLSIPREDFPEAASQTFKKGAPVFLNVGYLNEVGTDPKLVMGVATRDGQNGASAGSKTQTVELAHPDTLFVGNIDNGGSQGTGVTAATDRGKMYGITKHAASGKWHVDNAKAVGATSRVIVWNFWLTAQDGANQVIGDTLGWVVFSFDPQYFQGNKTS